MSAKFFTVSLETQNFSFEAFGSSEQECVDALEKALAQHGKEYGLAPGWWTEKYEFASREVILGAGYRDREIIAHPMVADESAEQAVEGIGRDVRQVG